MRNATADETIYLRETLLISELLKNDIWIGNYGVGLHGFLFKLPVAIIFIIIGRPSVFVATLYTILLSTVSVVFFYKIVKRFFKEGNYAFWSAVIFSLFLHYLTTTISFNRDVPVIFTVLLFIYLFLKKSSPWLIGLSLLLMLDAKEHVFITVAPLYAFYVLTEQIFFVKGKKILEKIKNISSKLFKGYVFSVVWIVLMFTTSIIPINMFVASTTGAIEQGLSWNKSQFTTNVATQNLLKSSDAKEVPSILEVDCIRDFCTMDPVDSSVIVYENYDIRSDGLVCKALTLIDMLFSYMGKILYPRTFSFISVPKIIALPAIVYSISLLIDWFKKKDRKLILPMILLFNVLILILRASHGRYLLSVTPIFALFFVMFIQDGLKREKYFRNVLIATTIFVLLGLYFESTFVLPRIILEVSLLILFWSIWFWRKNHKIVSFLKQLFLSALALGMLASTVAFFYSIGQISNYLKYGYNNETPQMVEHVPEEHVIWVNDYQSRRLMNFYRRDLYKKPEWRWNLAEWVPKRSLLRVYQDSNTYSFGISEDISRFKENIDEREIEMIVMVVSLIEGDEFADQDRLEDILLLDWLELKEMVELKNKEMYLFKVVH